MYKPRRAKYQPKRAVAAPKSSPFVKLGVPSVVGLAAIATVGATFGAVEAPEVVVPAPETSQIPTNATEAAAVSAFTKVGRTVTLKETPTVIGNRYLKTDLNIFMSPGGKVITKLPGGSEIKISKNVKDGYREISHEDASAWVLDSMLLTSRPSKWDIRSFNPETFTAVCSRGSGVENGLRQNTVDIYRSICKLFPEVRSYGGVRADSMPYHPSGRALDIMLPGSERSEMGWAIAKYLVAHSREFNIDHIIFEQKLWYPGIGSWRGMSDRGGVTANHYDHVHVAVRG